MPEDLDVAVLNAGYVAELYDRYRRDPASVDPQTRAAFQRWTPGNGEIAAPDDLRRVAGAVNLAGAIRSRGHLAARVDPLGGPPPGDPALEPAAHGISEEDLRRLPAGVVGGPAAARSSDALQAIAALRAIYTATTGFDFDHVRAADERTWLTDAVESGRFHPRRNDDGGDPAALLRRLTEVEVFEQFLHRIFPGKFRFSLEGLDLLVPMLDAILDEAAGAGVRTALLGMAHRGRLNVLAHILRKPYARILAEFKDPLRRRDLRDDLDWTGDVTYHRGRRAWRDAGDPGEMAVILAPNPSHVEAVNPVIEGMARAAATSVDRPGAPQIRPDAVLAVLIHGDAAFPGQGVVAETLNLSRLPGYATGGTIHIIANNQLGYTTSPGQGRSTLYASDPAKGFEVPIVHVNADDPEACLAAARLAWAYRRRFQRDVLIDLVGYRRYGHNEADEPAFTQPVLYARIREHPTARAQWAQALVRRGIIGPDVPDALVRERMAALQEALQSLRPEETPDAARPAPPPPGAARRVGTGVPLPTLRELHEALLRVPEGFAPHPKIERAMSRRRAALAEPDAATVDWATGESLAFAAILMDGVAIRLTGQDTERGTFSHRHAVFHDIRSGGRYVPLQHLPQAAAAYEVHNSPLSEPAALAFEYGYNAAAPDRLVLWEAQYGDFINNAQAVVDEFITSARAKWGHTPSLVLLLPHGLEGAGPDHSSGRGERFLQLAAETNIRVANCTTAAQYFHLLRRQAALLRTDPLPLVVMTPKGLLRHPRTASTPRALAEGRFEPVLADEGMPDEGVRRLLLCSGKVFVDLDGSEARSQHPEVAIVRLEQLYPFPDADLARVLDRYGRLEEIVWVQEEPENMGAWTFVWPRLLELAGPRVPLRYVGRPANASPAEGSAAWFARNQEALVAAALSGAHGPSESLVANRPAPGLRR